MSERLVNWSHLRERWTGKWQIPLLFVALAALALALVTYRSPASKIPFDQVRGQLGPLIDRGLYTAAMESADILLQLPDKTPTELAPVHAALARARLLRAEKNGVTLPGIGKSVIDSYEQAVDGGLDLSVDDYLHLGKANEWAGRLGQAVRNYELYLGQSPGPHLDLRRRVVDLAIDRLGVAPVALEPEIDAVLEEAADRPDLLAWAAEHKITLLCDSDRCRESQRVLDAIEPRLSEAPWVDHFAYLRAYAFYRLGRYDDAERALRLLRDGLALRDALYARSGWLLGRAVLRDDGPQRPMEAMAIFEDVMGTHGAPPYSAAAELGLAEALVMMQRFDEALGHYQGALRRIGRLPAGRVLNRGAVELSLTLASGQLRREGRLSRALQFAQEAMSLATEDAPVRYAYLLERVAELKAALAYRMRAAAETLAEGEPLPFELVEDLPGGEDAAADSDPAQRARRLVNDARELLLESGALYERVASLTTMDDQRSSAAAWLACQRTHESGVHDASIEMMRRFIREHPHSPMVPRAMRLLGAAQQALGRYAEAIETYQENHRRYPRTPDAGSSLIPLARCFVAGGKKYAPQAERTLRLILDDSEVFTPAATEYADALFLLGELLNRWGQYERAVPVLEEAMTRYPDDPRRGRANFLLGDCYLQSGLAMKEDVDQARFAGERERLVAERRNRLSRAAQLFGEMVREYGACDPADMSRRDRVYLRHARLYQADCLFELGDYERSLAHYERAAWIYRDSSTSLAAYVQIINCHTFGGNGAEASAALRRALYLVETLPDDAFGGEVALEARGDWRRYFEWVADCGLF